MRHVVTLDQIESFGGAVAPATFICPSGGICSGELYVAVRDKTYEYNLKATARGDGRITLSVLRAPSTSMHPDDILRRLAVPRLSFGQSDWFDIMSFDVMLQSNGAGLRDVAVTALVYGVPRGLDYGILIPPPPKTEQRVPVASVRVTMRREDAPANDR